MGNFIIDYESFANSLKMKIIQLGQTIPEEIGVRFSEVGIPPQGFIVSGFLFKTKWDDRMICHDLYNHLFYLLVETFLLFLPHQNAEKSENAFSNFLWLNRLGAEV